MCSVARRNAVLLSLALHGAVLAVLPRVDEDVPPRPEIAIAVAFVAPPGQSAPSPPSESPPKAPLARAVASVSAPLSAAPPTTPRPHPRIKPSPPRPAPPRIATASPRRPVSSPVADASPGPIRTPATLAKPSDIRMRAEKPPPAAPPVRGSRGVVAAVAPVSLAPRFRGGGLANPAPRYPYMARRRGLDGRVILRVRVSATGAAEAVSVRRSSGHRLLDEAATRAVRNWRFAPARRAGRAVAGTVDVPVDFRLRD